MDEIKGRAITAADVKGKPAVNIAHINRGANGYGYSYRMVETPRIGFFQLVNKGAALKASGQRQQTVWTLDGEKVDSLEAAIAGHAIPPKLSDQEKLILAMLPREFADLRAVEKSIAQALGIAIFTSSREEGSAPVIGQLVAKGLAELGRRYDQTSVYIPTVRRRS